MGWGLVDRFPDGGVSPSGLGILGTILRGGLMGCWRDGTMQIFGKHHWLLRGPCLCFRCKLCRFLLFVVLRCDEKEVVVR